MYYDGVNGGERGTTGPNKGGKTNRIKCWGRFLGPKNLKTDSF